MRGNKQFQKPEQYSLLFDLDDEIIRSLSDQDQNIKGQSNESNPQVKWKKRMENSDPMFELYQDEEEDQMEGQKMAHEQKYNSFISSKIKISKIVERKSKLQEEQEQLEFQMIPCPYCAKLLTLSELDHTQNCRYSFQCRYCKETYPKALLSDHLIVCNKIHGNRNKSKKQLLAFSNDPAEKNKRVNIFKSKAIKSQRVREQMRQDMGEFGNYDPYQLDMLSVIHAEANKGLGNRQINALKKTIYSRKGDRRESQCSVCMNQLQSGEVIMKLNCSHFFHEDCLRPWLEVKTQCPTCKADIKG